MTTVRFLTRALCALAVVGAARSATPAADDATPYFCARFASSAGLERVAAGPDGSVCVASTAYTTALPGQIDPPDPPESVHAFVTVFEPDGRVRWTRFLPNAWVRDLRVTPDGAVWLAASADYDQDDHRNIARLTKIGPDGTVLATVQLDGKGDERPNSIALASNGDVVVVGTTTSADFPVLDAFQPEFGGNADGFVARIRGDGSGIVWSSYVGGPAFDDANSVAVDATGDVLVTTRERLGNWQYEPTNADLNFDVTSVALVRISEDGVPVSTIQLPRGDFGGAYDVAVAGDGRILVGGVIGWRGRGPAEGYVLPIDPATSELGIPWHEPDREVNRISVGPSGEVLVGTDRNRYDQYSQYRTGGGFVLLTPDLAAVIRRVDREENWGVLDVAFAPDGALCISTIGGSAAVPFNEPPATLYGGEPFVGRLRASGAPSSVRVRRVTVAETTLAWTNDGDSVVGYDVEEVTSDPNQYPYGSTVRRVGGAGANAHAVRLRGLLPGSTHHLRLVANFASGVRTSVAVPVVLTPPARARRVQVRNDSGPGVDVDWDCRRNGDRTFYELERSVGLGPFEPVSSYRRPVGYCYRLWFHDGDVSRDDGFIIYRVRAVTVEPRVATSWTYSGWVLAR